MLAKVNVEVDAIQKTSVFGQISRGPKWGAKLAKIRKEAAPSNQVSQGTPLGRTKIRCEMGKGKWKKQKLPIHPGVLGQSLALTLARDQVFNCGTKAEWTEVGRLPYYHFFNTHLKTPGSVE